WHPRALRRRRVGPAPAGPARCAGDEPVACAGAGRPAAAALTLGQSSPAPVDPAVPVRRRGEPIPRGGTMRYVLLICGDESAVTGPDEQATMHAEYDVFGQEMGQRGVLVGGERLHPTSDATTVRVRDGAV